MTNDWECYGAVVGDDDDYDASDTIMGDTLTVQPSAPPLPRRRRKRMKVSSSSRDVTTEPSWRHIDDRGSDGKIPKDDCYEYKPAGSSRGQRSWTEAY